MLGGRGLKTQERFTVAHHLGVAYFRPWDITIEGWSGQQTDAAAARRAGFALVLTVRHSGSSGPPAVPSAPPRDLETYRRILGDVLDAYHPEVLCVEHEENSSASYTGTPEEYAAELKAACAIAHGKGVACANGGLTSRLVTMLIWDRYRSAGDQNGAEAFLARAAGRERQEMASPSSDQAIARGKALLALYRDVGLDYVNFHWYGADPEVLSEAVEYLRSSTGLQPMTNEIGQSDTRPSTVQALLQRVLDLGLPYAVWYSVDRRSRALQYPDGTLRETGRAFKAFIERTFARRRS